MKCHYDVLDVPRDADDAQIKTSYRKLALKWHPDKNLDNCEYAKTEFQLVQQAYEILSDRQERAWYDKHREQILCGSNSEYKDSDLNIFQYFTSSCFKGYGDDDNGFYTVYRKAFEEIVQDDIKYTLDKEEMLEVPSFGTSISDYEDVVGPFYDFWSSYCTTKNFIWLDHYNIQEVRDRRVLKLIEKEHKKIRQKAKKEWNEEVRALIAFIRKRDKRVKEYAKIREAKLVENRQKNEELSKQKRLERRKLLNESNNSEAEWTKFDNVKNELEQIEKSLAEEFGDQISEDEEDEELDFEPNNLYCVACNKIFKSPKAFANHELSKKHKEHVLRLKQTMKQDCSENEEQPEDISYDSDDLIGTNEEKLTVENPTKQKKKQKRTKNLTRESISEDDFNYFSKQNLEEDFNFENTKRKSKNKKSSIKENEHVQDSTSIEICLDEVNDDDEKVENDEKITKNKKKSRTNKHAKETNSVCQNLNSSHCCVTCKTDFSSKNKLFTHLKKTGHSVYIPQNQPCTKSVKNKKLDQ